MISSKTIAGIAEFSAAINVIAKGGAAFKKNLKALSDEADRADAATKALAKAQREVKVAQKQLSEREAAVTDRENAIDTAIVKAEAAEAKATEAAQLAETRKADLHVQSNKLQQQIQEFEAERNDFNTSSAIRAEDLEKREADLVEREARVDRILSAAEG